MKNILIITGVLPPKVCGVGDYTKNLLDTEIGKLWSPYVAESWRFRKLSFILKSIDQRKPDVIFMQYPAEGYGWSLVPHMLLIYYVFIKKIKFITVLHEYSSLSWKSRFFIRNILSKSSQLIFTTNFELNNLAKHVPGILSKANVLPILSNIPNPKEIKQISDRSIDILYFGHIRPNKGIEDFLRVICSSKIVNKNLSIKLVGQIPKGYENYIKSLQAIYPQVMNITTLNADLDLVHTMLGEAKICFLPYPDGISERRGSFLAAIQHGSVVASYVGTWTPSGLTSAFIPLERGHEAEKILYFLSNNELLTSQQLNSISYHNESGITNWNELSNAYLKISEL
ncbi:glycosyl transferase, group 1 family protein [Geobacter metallireducens RCH3]|nr:MULTISPECIES: hypothetical protein [Geobacter]EHP83987.1 glycosyl transferase, group 1 family protein [Geobacter metallireducens RCH3]MBT1075487.1 glycosyl transferase family 1 [Geobacter grbiciae]